MNAKGLSVGHTLIFFECGMQRVWVGHASIPQYSLNVGCKGSFVELDTPQSRMRVENLRDFNKDPVTVEQ